MLAGPSANGGSGRGSNTDASGGGGSPMAASTSKQMSKGQLLSELHAMRSRMAEEQSRRKEAEAEKVGLTLGMLCVLRCCVLRMRYACSMGAQLLSEMHAARLRMLCG